MTRKTIFAEDSSRFKFSNLRLTLGNWRLTLKFYTSVAKELKVKVRKSLELIPGFVEVTGKKLVGGGNFFSPPPLGLTKLPHLFQIVTKTCKRRNYSWKIPMKSGVLLFLIGKIRYIICCFYGIPESSIEIR